MAKNTHTSEAENELSSPNVSETSLEDTPAVSSSGGKSFLQSVTSGDGKLLLGASIVTLLVVAGLTGFFYWQNAKLTDKIAEIRGKTAEYQTKVEVLKADPMVRAGELFANQKEALSQAIYRSNAAIYVREMQKMQKDFGINFSGFSFALDKVTTGVSAQKGLDSDAVQKLIKLIAGYREKTPEFGTGSTVSKVFDLGPVLNVS